MILNTKCQKCFPCRWKTINNDVWTGSKNMWFTGKWEANGINEERGRGQESRFYCKMRRNTTDVSTKKKKFCSKMKTILGAARGEHFENFVKLHLGQCKAEVIFWSVMMRIDRKEATVQIFEIQGGLLEEEGATWKESDASCPEARNRP